MEYGQGTRAAKATDLVRGQRQSQDGHTVWTQMDETGLQSSLYARLSQHVALLLPQALPSVTLLNISPQMWV